MIFFFEFNKVLVNIIFKGDFFNFQTHGKGKQLGPIIHKYIKFLYQYTIHEPQQSSLILHKYVNLLR